MNIFNTLTTQILELIRTNAEKIVIAVIILVVFYVGYIVTSASLKKLQVDVFSYYPFDQFFPQSGKWSILYFFIVILLLGVLIFFLGKGGFVLNPA